MNRQAKIATEAGWQEVARGYWAQGPWRVQRLTSGWRWWHVVDAKLGALAGIPNAGARGYERTMLDAMRAVAAAARLAPPSTEEPHAP